MKRGEGGRSTRRRNLRWRDYRTGSGARPVKTFIDKLTDEEAAEVVAGLKEISDHGLERARHLRGEIYEVRVSTETRIFRVLFAQETKFILLSLSAFAKKTKRTPPAELDLAETRLADWRRRGKQRRSP